MIIKHRNAITISFSTSIEYLTRARQDSKAIPSLSCSKHPITSILQKCSVLKDLKSIHVMMIKNNAHQDSFFINQFVTTCSQFCQMNYAFLTFTQMVDPNVYVYNAMIKGFVQCSTPIKALYLYVDMLTAQVLPTTYTFSSLVKACIQVPANRFGEAVHGQIRKVGFGSQVFIQTGLVDFYSNIRMMEAARRVFDEMTVRDVVSWTTMIFGYARFGNLDSARRLFEEMPHRNIVSWNTMLAGYARSGDVESATLLFNQMLTKDLISWTTMISCYSQNKLFKEAIETFKGMKAAGVSPDEVTIATVISACAHLGALDMGKELHSYVMLNRFDLDVYIGSSLIDMYAKCGSIERSLIVFLKLKEKNLFCWNSMIEGLAFHGRGKDALHVFRRMVKEGEITPNGVTFVSVLSACTHAGLVEEGRRMFVEMIRDHSISPAVEHYGCMVDLLGRAGLLREALDLIQTMLMEPNSVVWGALLGSCKIYGNIEIGQVAVEKLLVLEPNNSGYYVLLVNMYAEANRWSEVASVRSMMKGRKVQKNSPGFSWIEMEGIVHEFAASDMTHSSSDEICFVLIGLNEQLKLIGYVPEWGFNSLV